MALLIIGLILGFACFGYFIYKVVKFVKLHVKDSEAATFDKESQKGIGIPLFAQGLTTILSSIGFVLALKLTLKAYEWILLILGSYVFATAFLIIFGAFVIYYYKPELIKEQRKAIKKAMLIAIPVALVGLIMLTEGFANEISYPLPNGISFTEGLTYPEDHHSGFSIAWYGILIVTGAVICYIITDHNIYKKYGKHGLIDTLFIVAFVAGVIGSRLWFCYILEPTKYIGNFREVVFPKGGFRGLAIQGGALLGAATGIAFVLVFRKYMDVRFVMDVAMPSILIAQMLGRWGNFFNNEVYGMIVSEQSICWLPSIIRNNMFIDGAYRLPLFFIEGVINLGGYFVIRYLLGKVCKFHLGLGYQASFYLVWYGMVRAILEPLREGFTLDTHKDGFGYIQSWIVAFAMIAGGLLLFGAFIILHKVRMNKGKENEFGEKI